LHTSGLHVSVQLHGTVPQDRQNPGIGVCAQLPEAETHASVVQGFPSSQFTGVRRQPRTESQLSIWHKSPAGQVMGGLLQVPLVQISLVHALLSLQLPTLHPLAPHERGGKLQPDADKHVSKVHGLLSLQVMLEDTHKPVKGLQVEFKQALEV